MQATLGTMALLAAVFVACKSTVLSGTFAYQPGPALVDVISLNPTGLGAGTGYDLLGASTQGGYDVALGFALKVAYDTKISAINFLVAQREPGAGLRALVYLGSGKATLDNPFSWLPKPGTAPAAVFELASPLPSEGDTNFHVLRFQADTPFVLSANKPYVVVFDPIPTEDGVGDYVLANMPADTGFQSVFGASEGSVLMPPYLLKRLTDVKRNSNSWNITRVDRRYMVSVLVPEPAGAASIVSIGLLLCGLVIKARRRSP